jgi:hypothetical protein
MATGSVTTAASGPAVVAGGGAAAAPVTTAPGATAPAATTAPAAATATPTVDQRRILGTPQPGGVIDTILKSASGTAPDALNEGQYTTITDGNGAQMQVHVHGAWLYHPDQIAEGIRQGFVGVHVHPDGTVHLHDVRA